ncbi:MAG: hypothetical protein LBK53_03430 [Heliobacteriaceae bacterium]|jgi:hypothetical protein|nr:hypothetical protein [Heliobacteriaceae bacterium]
MHVEPIYVFNENDAGLNRRMLTVNFAASRHIGTHGVNQDVRDFLHSPWVHGHGSTVEVYVPEMYVQRFKTNASDLGLDISG